jgi:RimJ/RimL family protein N-acetyltransferase
MTRGNGVRLRPANAEEYERVALEWYQDPEVLRFSEGGAEPYGREQIRRMFDTLSRKGELYLIEILVESTWRAVGDAALLCDALPIAIGRPGDRSRGTGTEVLQLLLVRARELGWAEARVSGVEPANVRARRLYERAGFIASPAETPGAGAPIAMVKALDEES